MDTVGLNLEAWKSSLLKSIPIGGLLARNPTAYKWKATFKCWMLREAVSWRLQDLLAQSYELHMKGHGLGARILLRSGYETLGTLIYLNQLMQSLLKEKIDFFSFDRKVSQLLTGSRDGTTELESINILTVLQKCDAKYPGLLNIYKMMCESAHPNYEGIVAGYSRVDHAEFTTNFENRWMELYGEHHLDSLDLCMMTFHIEYNDVWPVLMTDIETWLVENDEKLERTKPVLEKANPNEE